MEQNDLLRWAAVSDKLNRTGLSAEEKADAWWKLIRIPIDWAEIIFYAPDVEQILQVMLPEPVLPGSPAHLVSQVANHVGYAIFSLQRGVAWHCTTLTEELLVDTVCSLELLLQKNIAEQLGLNPRPGSVKLVSGTGGSVIALECEAIKVTATLEDKATQQQLKRSNTITPHVIFTTVADRSSWQAEYDELEPDVVPMETAAVLELRGAPTERMAVLPPETVVAAGFGRSLLGRKGLQKLGLEVNRSKSHLYPVNMRVMRP